MRKKSTREVGDEFENDLLSRLGPGFRMTAGSGSKWRDGDLSHRAVVLEAKVKNSTEGFSAPLRELNKLWDRAEMEGKDWIYAQKNSTGRKMLLIDLEFFLEISEEWRARNA